MRVLSLSVCIAVFLIELSIVSGDNTGPVVTRQVQDALDLAARLGKKSPSPLLTITVIQAAKDGRLADRCELTDPSPKKKNNEGFPLREESSPKSLKRRVSFTGNLPRNSSDCRCSSYGELSEFDTSIGDCPATPFSNRDNMSRQGSFTGLLSPVRPCSTPKRNSSSNDLSR